MDEQLAEVDDYISKHGSSGKEANKSYKERMHTQILNDMPGYLVHEIDFSKFASNSVYSFANSLASRNDIAGI